MVFLSCLHLLEQCILSAKFTHHHISRQYQNKPDDGLVETGRRRHTDVGLLHQAAINIGIDNIRGRVDHSGIPRHLIEQAKIGIENTSDVHKRQRNESRHDGRKRNIPDLLPLAGAVQRSRLIKRRIDTVDRGDIDQASIADSLPCVDEAQDKRPVFRFRIPVDRIEPSAGRIVLLTIPFVWLQNANTI